MKELEPTLISKRLIEIVDNLEQTLKNDRKLFLGKWYKAMPSDTRKTLELILEMKKHQLNERQNNT